MNAIAPIERPWISNPRYVVRADGTIIGASGRTVKPRLNQSGYARISVNQGGGKNKDFYVHRVVLETFVGPCPANHEADHINGNRSDNHLNNLRWLPRSENLSRRKILSGEAHPNAWIPNDVVKMIRLATGSSSHIAARFGVSRRHVSDIKSGKARANA